MRAFVLTMVLGIMSLGGLAATPAHADAREWRSDGDTIAVSRWRGGTSYQWRGGTRYYNPGYNYRGGTHYYTPSYGYPSYYPSYNSYYSPGYSNYYSPAYPSYAPSYRYYSQPGVSVYFGR